MTELVLPAPKKIDTRDNTFATASINTPIVIRVRLYELAAMAKTACASFVNYSLVNILSLWNNLQRSQALPTTIP